MRLLPLSAGASVPALMLVLLLAACGVTIIDPDEPVTQGPIVSIQGAADAHRIHVEALPGTGDPCGIVATVDGRTRILVPAGGTGFRTGSMADLAVGDTVAVYVRGAVAESCPLQGLASTIEKRRPGG
jgi:hypothetical protein